MEGMTDVWKTNELEALLSVTIIYYNNNFYVPFYIRYRNNY